MLYTFALPIKADKVPAGPDWLHEVKYDGYRMMLTVTQGCELGTPFAPVSANPTLDRRTSSTAGDDRSVWDDRHA